MCSAFAENLMECRSSRVEQTRAPIEQPPGCTDLAMNAFRLDCEAYSWKEMDCSCGGSDRSAPGIHCWPAGNYC